MNRNTFGMEAQAVDESVNGPKIKKRINRLQKGTITDYGLLLLYRWKRDE